MNGGRNGLSIALTFIMISLAAMFAGCTSSANNDGNYTVVVGDSIPQPTIAAMTEPANDSETGDNIAWFGVVTDSFGKPFGETNVTLHLMTGEGEAFNMTTRSNGSLPYPGSYVFDNIQVSEAITYAYAEAESGDLGDGIRYHGRTSNLTLNKSRISSGFIVIHVPMPDAITLTPGYPTINSGADKQGLPGSTAITAQLYLNGKPYKRAFQSVNFTSDNAAVGKLSEVTVNMTDEEGRSTIVLTGVSPGSVNVTANMKAGISRSMTDTCTVQVV